MGGNFFGLSHGIVIGMSSCPMKLRRGEAPLEPIAIELEDFYIYNRANCLGADSVAWTENENEGGVAT